MTDQEPMQLALQESIKRHYKHALIVAIAPVIFLLIIGIFTDLQLLVALITPLVALNACYIFMKNVLADISKLQ